MITIHTITDPTITTIIPNKFNWSKNLRMIRMMESIITTSLRSSAVRENSLTNTQIRHKRSRKPWRLITQRLWTRRSMRCRCKRFTCTARSCRGRKLTECIQTRGPKEFPIWHSRSRGVSKRSCLPQWEKKARMNQKLKETLRIRGRVLIHQSLQRVQLNSKSNKKNNNRLCLKMSVSEYFNTWKFRIPMYSCPRESLATTAWPFSWS